MAIAMFSSVCLFCSFLFQSFVILQTKIMKLPILILTTRREEGTKQEKMSMEQYLPRELVSNILSRLPAKDLLKCKRVCKSWFDLLTDPHFISNYYVVHNSLQSLEKHLLVIRRPFLSNLKTSISLLSWNANDSKNLVSSDVLNPSEYNSEHKYWSEISGPCNGIYFLEGNPNVVINPSLRQFKALPEFYLSGSSKTYSLSDHSGFGFDSKTNDYKVVVIRDIWSKETNERKPGHWTADLYSLNHNSWRKLGAAIPFPIEIWSSSWVYTYVNNCCHWWGYVDDSGRREDCVLAFDMVSESFRKIKVPRIRGSAKEEFATLAPFNESATIGVIVYPVRGQKKPFDVWVMKDYWDEGSWVRKYSVEPIEEIHKLVGFYGSNQFLWSSRDEGLVWHDCEPETEQMKDLQVHGKNGSLRAARYMESLVSLKRGNEFSWQLVSCSMVPDHLLDPRK
ncbi:unnamed protein product [Sphenostylis stenocarpa]|uniref:F-box domain-containing protein n=1 Tax=Sphenostylis stenocarpa TaxID=92480 RepID=A0AA86VV41_9FABA|nr:unnamed protein product [Sphenostylis stenocarpa]